MTQLQKIVAKAKILKKSYPNTKWTDLIKKASKLVTPASKSFAGTKKVIKKSPLRSLHKDTKSHNVNIRVVSGVPDNYSFSLGTVELYTQKQFTIFGKVELVIFEPKEKKTIVVLDGKNTKESVKKLLTYIITHNKYKDYDYDIWEEKLNKLIIQLNKEITKYNKDIKSPKTVIKKTASKSYKPKKSIVKKQTVKRSPVKRTRSSESEKIRSTVKKDGFIMPHGYGVAKAKRVMSGMEKTNRYIKDIENRIQLIKKHEREIEIVKEWMTRHDPYRTLSDKNMMKKEILELKQAISLYKHDIKILKKFIK